MDTPTRISLLEPVPLFAGVPPDGMREIAAAAYEIPLHPEDTLFHQGDDAAANHVIAWGRLRLDQTTPDGQNVVIRYMDSRDLVGTVAVIRGVPFPATAVAVEDSMILSWHKEVLFGQMEYFPSIATNAMRIVGGRIEELQARLSELATQRVERRIAATLLRLVRQSGRRTDDGIEIPFSLSRQDVAELTATTLHTVSRTLSAWQQEGILSGRRGDHFVIHQPHRLVQIAEDA